MSGWLTMVVLTTRRAELAAIVGLDVAEVSLKINFRSAVGSGGGRSVVGFCHGPYPDTSLPLDLWVHGLSLCLVAVV
jgi:hypothetical protein